MKVSRRDLLLFFACLLGALSLLSSCSPKLTTTESLTRKALKRGYEDRRVEMRGVWMPIVGRSYYRGKSREEIKSYIIQSLDRYAMMGVNAVFFQVRSEGDAFYPSRFEPWSRFLTGTQGKAPEPYWDPLDFVIREAHKRHMELHAWINPYRVSTDASISASPLHVSRLHPEWCVRYGNLLILNPALQEVRDYTTAIVSDLVTRYDIDGIHMDDYFYPYPESGRAFEDDREYQLYGTGYQTKGDFRRANVNRLIEQLHSTIKGLKPWVRFGISPFGIYRNKRTDPVGSETKGLQNYDDLFADVLLWDRMGWVDYLVPQIYWQMGHRFADYSELAFWWQRETKRSHLYIGQSIRNTMDNHQLEEKWIISEKVSSGNLLFPHEDLLSDYMGIGQKLRAHYWTGITLLPPSEYPDYLRELPEEPKRDATILKGNSGQELVWLDDPDLPDGLETKYYVIYTHRRGATEGEIYQKKNITALTTEARYKPLDLGGKYHVAFTITRIDRYNHEHLVARNVLVTL